MSAESLSPCRTKDLLEGKVCLRVDVRHKHQNVPEGGLVKAGEIVPRAGGAATGVAGVAGHVHVSPASPGQRPPGLR